mgnify:CR=1 FL=1
MSNNARTAAEQHDIIGYKSSEKEFTRTDDAGAKWFFEKTNLGLFIHFGISAAGDDIDISWGMMDNPDRRAKGNGILTPREYWALAEKFDPKHFEPKKWLSAAKDAGFTYAVFTAKHHDGFANWPSKYTDYSVAATPWKDGRGDVVREFCDACRKYGIQRYHQVSTDEVYGDLPLDRPDLFFTEETPIHTSSPYSSSKAAADLLVLAYHRTYGLPVTISRCSNNYGPYHFPEKLIPLMIANALADKPLPVYGEGLNVRDWLYVEDHCKAIDLIIHKGRVGEVYNVGGHNEKQNIEIVKIICKELGKPESLITHVGDRKGHDMRYAIDPTKIHNELGWLPETKFEDGIKKTIQWYLDNREWWETIISGEYQNYYEKMYSNR